jgi:aspartate aminotransferase-like enzyme
MGKIWRVGLMGNVAQPDNVRTFLTALAQVLTEQGSSVDGAAGTAAAEAVLSR